MARKSEKNEAAGVERFPPLFIEALAYHEAGHAVMAALLNVPILRVVIGPACEVPNTLGIVEFDYNAEPSIRRDKFAMISVASEPVVRLAPNHTQLATLHSTRRHQAMLTRAVRYDLRKAFHCLLPVYEALGYSESTARRELKDRYRDLAQALFEVPVNRAAVHHLASVLMTRHATSGAEATASILAGGPLTTEGLLEQFGHAT